MKREQARKIGNFAFRFVTETLNNQKILERGPLILDLRISLHKKLADFDSEHFSGRRETFNFHQPASLIDAQMMLDDEWRELLWESVKTITIDDSNYEHIPQSLYSKML